MFIPYFLITACQEDKIDIGAPEPPPCNMIENSHCMLPFPSHHFLSKDETSTSGYRVNFAESALPANTDDVPFNPEAWNQLDGFSLGSTAYTLLEGATLNGTTQWPDLETSDGTNQKTIFLELETNRRIPHTVERETLGEPTNEALLMLRPMVPLRPNQTYVIGIRKLIDSNGNVVPAPEGFREIRNGSDVPESLAHQVAQYENVIFPALDEEGFNRTNLQLAWSFHTRSDDVLTSMKHVREDLLDFAMTPIPYSIEEIEYGECENDNEGTIVNGVMTVPLYLDSWDPGSFLNRDGSGLPTRNGTVDVGFKILIGCSVLEGTTQGTLVQYGHGLLGKRSEVDSGYLHQLADDHGLIFLAADWTGMKIEDSSAITLNIVQDASAFQTVPDRLHQGWMEFMALTLLARQSHFIADPLFQLAEGSMIDPDRIYFYGNSQGAVLGGGYAAMHGGMDGVILGVGGAPFNLLLHRAEGFEPFLLILANMYESWVDITLVEALFQQIWDPTESIGWSHLLNTNVLMQSAIGDGSVPTIGSHVLARAFEAKLVLPAARSVYGLDSVEAPFFGSGYVEWDYDIADSDGAYPALNETGFDPHNGPRNSQSGMQQIGHFIQTGEIAHFCDGPCNFE